MVFNYLTKSTVPYASPSCEMFEVEGMSTILSNSAVSSIDDWTVDPEVVNL